MILTEINKYLLKIANDFDVISNKDKNQGLKDAISTGLVGAAGGITSFATNKILHPKSKFSTDMKSFALGTGLGLVGDYAALKLSQKINKKIDKTS